MLCFAFVAVNTLTLTAAASVIFLRVNAARQTTKEDRQHFWLPVLKEWLIEKSVLLVAVVNCSPWHEYTAHSQPVVHTPPLLLFPFLAFRSVARHSSVLTLGNLGGANLGMSGHCSMFSRCIFQKFPWGTGRRVHVWLTTWGKRPVIVTSHWLSFGGARKRGSSSAGRAICHSSWRELIEVLTWKAYKIKWSLSEMELSSARTELKNCKWFLSKLNHTHYKSDHITFFFIWWHWKEGWSPISMHTSS